MAKRQSSKPGAPINQPADWSELLPELLKPRKPPTMQQFSAAIQAVATSHAQGYITEAEADLLLRHICSAFIANQVTDLLSALSANPFPKSRGHQASAWPRLLSPLTN